MNDTAERQTLVFESFNYSIRDQAEIDQIETALGALNRGPEGRLAVYRMAKQKFLDVLRENRDIIDAIKATKIDVKAQLSPGVEKLDTELRDNLADLEVEELGATEEALNENENRKQDNLEDLDQAAPLSLVDHTDFCYGRPTAAVIVRREPLADTRPPPSLHRGHSREGAGTAVKNSD
ncbi:MAG: hypothetical protein JHC52_08135 [Chthoniobacterales bacterium]|nr:hypothetical protein [Chthoniobacterales bacterium]